MNISQLNELIKYIEEFLKNEEKRSREQILKKILNTISDLIEIVSEKYYQEILEGKNASKLLEFISILKDFSLQLEKFVKNEDINSINELLKFNLIYFKSLL